MSQIKSITLILAALCLIAASVSSAPTDTEASSTTAATASSAPTTPAAALDSSSTASMAVSSAQDTVQPVVNTTFTCFNRKVGYYADLEADCKIYHFCMLGDYNGQEMYQRVSYLCLNGTTFDQQALDCVESAKMTAPCAESEKYYEESNAVLRKAIVGKPEMNEHASAAAATETSASAAPSSESATSEAPASEAPASATTITSTTEAPSSTQGV